MQRSKLISFKNTSLLMQRLTYDICRQYAVCKGTTRKEIIVCV